MNYKVRIFPVADFEGYATIDVHAPNSATACAMARILFPDAARIMAVGNEE